MRASRRKQLVAALTAAGVLAGAALALAAGTANPPANAKNPVRPAIAPAVKPAAAPLVKPAAASVVKPAAAPMARPAAAPVAKSAVAPAAKPAAKSAVAPAAKPALKPVPTAKTAAKPAPAAKPVAAAPAKPVRFVAPAPAVDARTAAAMSPLRPVPRQAVAPQPLAHLDEALTYQYNALGRRDPFAPLMGGAFVGDDVGGDAPADIGGIKVVGIVWGAEDRFALCEDARGNSLVLRTGDKVMNGYVEGLQRDKLIVNLTVDGQSQSVAIPLTRKGENSNANR